MPTDDRILAVYEAVRAHERQLNTATAAFEHAVIAPLFLLNGGAAVAFLTLVGSLSDPDSRLDIVREEVVGAVLSWGVGLGLAAAASWFGLRAQQGYAVGERIRRGAVEAAVLDGVTPLSVAGIGDAIPVSNRAQRLKAGARRNQLRFAACVGLGIAAFIVGTAFGAASII